MLDVPPRLVEALIIGGFGSYLWWLGKTLVSVSQKLSNFRIEMIGENGDGGRMIEVTQAKEERVKIKQRLFDLGNEVQRNGFRIGSLEEKFDAEQKYKAT